MGERPLGAVASGGLPAAGLVNSSVSDLFWLHVAFLRGGGVGGGGIMMLC